MTDLSEDAAAFDRFLAGSAPEVAVAAMALRQAFLDAMPAAVECSTQAIACWPLARAAPCAA